MGPLHVSARYTIVPVCPSKLNTTVCSHAEGLLPLSTQPSKYHPKHVVRWERQNPEYHPENCPVQLALQGGNAQGRGYHCVREAAGNLNVHDQGWGKHVGRPQLTDELSRVPQAPRAQIARPYVSSGRMRVRCATEPVCGRRSRVVGLGDHCHGGHPVVGPVH